MISKEPKRHGKCKSKMKMTKDPDNEDEYGEYIE
jgi:hypothetical protein